MIGITGSSGFVGQNLKAYLTNNGLKIKQISRDEVQCVTPNLDGLESVIHLAGKAHDLKKSSSPDEYYKGNYELTKNLYDAFLKSDANTFVFISSVKAAADHLDVVLNEDFTPDPQTDYGKSKLMAENYIQSIKLPAGKKYYILRPCMIHGPGNKGNLNLLYKLISKRIPYPLGAYENMRSFLSVENLCFVINEIIQRVDIPSGIYNIADDTAMSTTTVIKYLADVLGLKPIILFIPKSLINKIARIGDILKLPLTTERLNKLTENYIVSNTKIKGALKKSLPLSAHQGIITTAMDFKKN